MKTTKSLRDAMIKSLTKKMAIMKANGSNCADIRHKINKYMDMKCIN